MTIKPTMRQAPLLEIESALRNTLRAVVSNGEKKSFLGTTDRFPYRNCLNCLHFKETEEICAWYKLRPPARVIAYGCESHDDKDEIPF